MKYLHTLTLISALLLSCILSYSQISEGGLPYTLSARTKSSIQIPKIKLDTVDNAALIKRDIESEDKQKGLPFATALKVDYSVTNSGIWHTLPDSSRVWLLELESSGASSLNFIFEYHLSPGAKFFIYNKSTGKVLGAYTHENNKPWGRLSVQPIDSDDVIFEYQVPKGVNEGTLKLETVGHGYLKIDPGRTFNDFGRSGECNKDINDIQGQGWQREKRAVVKIVAQKDPTLFSRFSGALINNTAQDTTPYVLTAEHCINIEEFAQNSIYYFNYESTVLGQDGDQSQTISGATLRATKPDLDFALVELSSKVPAEYQPYFAGWDRRDIPFEYGVGISHPRADVKKIAKSYSTIDPYHTFSEDYKSNAHWEVNAWEYSCMEPGSSGSPLFNPEHRIVGDLSGGLSTCVIRGGDNYQMLYYSWDHSAVNSQQLKHWLDPLITSVEYMDGFDPYPQEAVCFFPDKDLAYLDEDVIFTDHSVGEYTNYRWDFGEAAVPRTATGKGSHTVTYNNIGTYTATLDVTNSQGEDEQFILNNYIEIFYRPANANFEVEDLSPMKGDTLVFTNLSTGSNTSYDWDFGEGAEPRTLTTTDNSPVKVVYTKTGRKTVSLIAHNPLEDDTLILLSYLNVDEEIIADFTISESPYFVGDSIHLAITDTTWNSLKYGLMWYIDGEDISWNHEEIDIVLYTSGTYEISLYVLNSYDVDTTKLQIKVYDHVETPQIDTSFVDNSTRSFEISNISEELIYLWDFGDGETSNELNPEHKYNEIGTYTVMLTASSEVETKTVSIFVEISSVTGITDMAIYAMNVYPNPASDFIKISLPNSSFGIFPINVSLLSLTGKSIYKNQISVSDFRIKCDNMPEGIYLLVLEDNTKNKIVKKLIIN